MRNPRKAQGATKAHQHLHVLSVPVVSHVQVFVSVPHVIPRSLHVAAPLQLTVQVPEQVTANFWQPCLQRTTNSAVASTVIVHSFDPFSWFISMRQFAFAAHVTVFFSES